MLNRIHELESKALEFLGLSSLERQGYTLKEYRNFWDITVEHGGVEYRTCVLAYLTQDLEPSNLCLRTYLMRGVEHESLSGIMYRCETFYNNLYMIVSLDDELCFPVSIYDFDDGCMMGERIYSMFTSTDTRYLVVDVYDNNTVLCDIGGKLKVMNWADVHV